MCLFVCLYTQTYMGIPAYWCDNTFAWICVCLSVYIHRHTWVFPPIGVTTHLPEYVSVCLSIYTDIRGYSRLLVWQHICLNMWMFVRMCFLFSCLSVLVYLSSSFVCLSVCVLDCVSVYLWVTSVGMSLTNKQTDRYIHRKTNIHMQIDEQTCA